MATFNAWRLEGGEAKGVLEWCRHVGETIGPGVPRDGQARPKEGPGTNMLRGEGSPYPNHDGLLVGQGSHHRRFMGPKILFSLSHLVIKWLGPTMFGSRYCYFAHCNGSSFIITGESEKAKHLNFF